jgi:hypothetical protein
MALAKGTATDHNDLLTKLEAFITRDHVLTVAVNAGGTGYTVGDIVTVSGGTFDTAARVRVLTAPAGVVATVRLWDSGAYTVDPTLTGAATTGGTGTGLTLNLTMESDPWTVELSSALSGTDKVRIFSGTGGGGVYVGMRTYNEDTGARQARNWCMFGISSYNGALPWYQQPDFPSGIGISTSTGNMEGTAVDGVFAIFKDNDGFPMTYWFHVTNRRIIVIAKLVDNVTTTPRYSSCYLGLLNPMGTSDEFPYPLFIAGSSSTSRCAWDDLTPAFHFNGIGQLGRTNTAGLNGPAIYFGIDGLWKQVFNWDHTFGASSRSESNLYTTTPVGQMNPNARPIGATIITDVPGSNLQWERIINNTGSFSTAPEFELRPTPNTAGEKRLLVPNVLTISNSLIPADYHIVGELDGVYWVSAAGTTALTPEDTLDDADSPPAHYRCYTNGFYTQIDGFMAIRED